MDGMNPSSSDSGGPVLDEATFQKLLAAAYVLQEHNDRQRDDASAEQAGVVGIDSDSAAALAQIVDAQHQIHTNRLDLAAAMKLIVERLRKITNAQGAAVCLLEQESATYPAGSGVLGGQVGTIMRPEASLSSSTLLHDVLLRSADTGNDFRVNPEVARRMGIQSLIAVPVFHDGKTAGSLELAFTKAHAFQERDVRTCQLMAGLVTEALARNAQEEWRKGVAAERASMLEVLERIKPQLARLANEPSPENSASPSGHDAPTSTGKGQSQEEICTKCGSEFAPGEAFCGSCGTSRSAVARNDLQSKWATLWNLKKVSDQLTAADGTISESVLKPVDPFAAPESRPAYLAEATAAPSDEPPITAIPELTEPVSTVEPEANALSTTSPTESPSSAAEPPAEGAAVPAAPSPDRRVWLKSITVSPPALQLKGFWQKHAGFIRQHPGDLALGAAAILFLITILWAVSSDGPTTSADIGTPANAAAAAKPKKKQAPAAPKLSFFEQLMVDMGLAEPPAVPSDVGNPNVPVWVDIHTGLYYCPGTDQYGKTPQGKIASQHDAQLDQFEPASRKVCD